MGAKTLKKTKMKSVRLSSGVGFQCLQQRLVVFCREGAKNKETGRCFSGRQVVGEESVIEGGATFHLHVCIMC